MAWNRQQGLWSGDFWAFLLRNLYYDLDLGLNESENGV